MAVLSIQSYVSKGYVGNRAATFVLERLGYEVWAIPTVIYSNHPGYGGYEGFAVKAERLKALFDGISAFQDITNTEAIISGYMGDKGQPETVSMFVKQIQTADAQSFYICDPVIANESGLFVEQLIAFAIRSHLLPLADILTPNQFELEFLAGIPINSVSDIITGCDILRELGSKTIVVTSSHVTEGRLHTICAEKKNIWSISVPRLAGPKHGAGDLFVALLTAELLRDKPLLPSVERAVSACWGVLQITKSAQDLALIAGQEELSFPTSLFLAEQIR